MDRPIKDKASTKEKRRSGFFPPPGQDFAIRMEPSPVKEKPKPAPAAPTASSVKDRRRSGFYPAPPEDFVFEIKAPAPPLAPVPTPEKPVNERKGLRGFSVSTLMAPTMDPTIATEALPTRASRASTDLRSRRSSSSTTATYSTAFSSRESFESRGRASSWGSQTSLESMAGSPLKVVPAGRRTYADYQIQLQAQNPNGLWMRNHRPAPIKKVYRSTAKPGELFAALPGEVLELILKELKNLHLQPGSESCATCWMRDCCSLMLTSRKWSKFARTALYEDIQLVGEESGHLKKKYKINYGGRLVLLRRTLRNAPRNAAIVRSLKVPQTSMLPQGVSVEEYHDLVASLVMACPNLEKLAGYYPSYNHTFTRLFHALSTRQQLKEMNWIIEPAPSPRQHRIRPSINGIVAPGDLQPQQSQDFYNHHVNWKHMTSLTMHCRQGATLTPNVLINDVLNCLPALQTLHLSHLPATAFNDRNLLCLPAVKKLTLSHLPGVTTAGLSAFATRKSSTSITCLTLNNTPIDELAVLVRIFSNLTSLTSFSLVQASPPELAADEQVMLFPYVASPTLRKLHWDITSPLPSASTADTILSRSISASGFPSLRVLRTPNDPDGVFQSVCRPRERVDLPADRYRYATSAGPGWSPKPNPSRTSSSTSFSFRPSSSHSRTGSRISLFSGVGGGGGGGSKETPVFAPSLSAIDLPASSSSSTATKAASDLHASRLAAQARLEAARRTPKFFINVLDEDNSVVEKYGLAGYIGSATSKIEYHLLPDEGGSDETGGLVGVKEMLGDCGEEIGVLPSPERETEKGSGMLGRGGRRSSSGILGRKEKVRERSRSRSRTRGGGVGADDSVRVREGCTGRWNAGEGLGDKKDRGRWMHTERGRWKGVVLS
jgi:hypothetical protein